jgi:hypothetical protein
MFFFEKKNQKTFVLCRAFLRGLPTAGKSFLLLFFKKEVLTFLLPGTIRLILTTRVFFRAPPPATPARIPTALIAGRVSK